MSTDGAELGKGDAGSFPSTVSELIKDGNVGCALSYFQ